MSVQIYHEVSNDKGDIFDRLKEEGIIYPAEIYSYREHCYIFYKHVFDYTKCDKKTLCELDERIKKEQEHYWDSLEKDKNLSDAERFYKFEEVKKLDAHLMPVHRTKRGGVGWILKYFQDQLPSVAIGRKYPDEVFEYFQECEGQVECHVRYQKDTDIENFLMKKYVSDVKSVNLMPDDNKQKKSSSLEKR